MIYLGLYDAVSPVISSLSALRYVSGRALETSPEMKRNRREGEQKE